MIDLGHELEALARAAGDARTADRLAERVRPMVARVRRRRAARGTGAVAAVAVLGVGLTVPSWTGGPTTPPLTPSDGIDVTTLACGQEATGPVGVSPDATLRVSPRVSAGRATTVSVAFPAVQATEARTVTTIVQDMGTVVLADGVVVGRLDSTEGAWSWAEGAGAVSEATSTGRYASCADGSDLPAGTYEVYAWVGTTVYAGSDPSVPPVTTVAGPATVRIGDDQLTDEPEPSPTDGVDATVLGCGQEVGPLATSPGAALTAAPFVFEGTGTTLFLRYPRTLTLEHLPEGASYARASQFASVVVADGTVVGRFEPTSYGYYGTTGVDEGDYVTQQAGTYVVCSGTGEVLPVGEYEVYAWDRWSLTDDSGARVEYLTAVAGPASVTIVAGDDQGEAGNRAAAELAEQERILAQLALEHAVAMARGAAVQGTGPDFPACLSSVPVSDPGAPLDAELILTGPAGGDAETVGTLRLTSTGESLTVTHPSAADLAVAWDGVVVGTVPVTDRTRVEATGTIFDARLVGLPESCTDTRLPAGQYTLVGAVDVDAGGWSGRLVAQTPLLTAD